MSTLSVLRDSMVEAGISPASADELIAAFQAEPTIGWVGLSNHSYTYQQLKDLESAGLLTPRKWYSPSDIDNPYWLAWAERNDSLVWWLDGQNKHWGSGSWANRPTPEEYPRLQVGDTYRVTGLQNIVDYSTVGGALVKTGTNTSGQATITSMSNLTNLTPGMLVWGPGVYAGTTVAEVDNPSGGVTLSRATWASGSGASYYFLGGGTVEQSAGIMYEYAGATLGWRRVAPYTLAAMRGSHGAYTLEGSTYTPTTDKPLVALTGQTSYSVDRFPRLMIPKEVLATPGTKWRVSSVWERITGSPNGTFSAYMKVCLDGVASSNSHRVLAYTYAETDAWARGMHVEARTLSQTSFQSYGATVPNGSGATTGDSGYALRSTNVDFNGTEYMVVTVDTGAINTAIHVKLYELAVEVL